MAPKKPERPIHPVPKPSKNPKRKPKGRVEREGQTVNPQPKHAGKVFPGSF